MINENIEVENAKLCILNFTGAPGTYNKAGDRNFGVMFDMETAKTLAADGWNIKYLKPRDEEEPPQAWLQVKVAFEHFPPEIYLVKKSGKALLSEDKVGLLDWAEIKYVDLTIKPYNWEYNGKTGLKAYLKKMFVTIREDRFDEKYYDVPDSAQSSIK